MVLIPAEMREYNAHQLVRITSYLLRKYLHMQLTSTRKKANAITSNILNRIAVRGQRKVADALGLMNRKFRDGKTALSQRWPCFWLCWSGVLKTRN